MVVKAMAGSEDQSVINVDVKQEFQARIPSHKRCPRRKISDEGPKHPPSRDEIASHASLFSGDRLGAEPNNPSQAGDVQVPRVHSTRCEGDRGASS
jgi:hypothetical protein